MDNFKIVNYNKLYFNKLNLFWNSIGLGGAHRGDSESVINDTLDGGGHLLIMLNSKEEIIGSSWLTNDKRRTYLHHFGIREDYRNKGMAIKLLEESLKYAKQDGYQVKLEVHRENIPAGNLYRKYGFTDLGDYEVLIIRDLSTIS